MLTGKAAAGHMSSHEGCQEEYRAAGVNSILTKPIKQPSVVEMLSEARKHLDAEGSLTVPSKFAIPAGEATA